jgi:GTP pyrophosphokinase
MSDINSAAALLRRALTPRLFSKSDTGGVLERIKRSLRQHNARADVGLVDRAYAIAKKAHLEAPIARHLMAVLHLCPLKIIL